MKSQTLKHSHHKKRLTSFLLTASMMFSVSAGTESVLLSANTEVSAANSYGLADSIQQGNILHCFDWKYNDIKAELPNIAEAGFTSVQTSPAQVGAGSGIWWWLYQPLGFYVGNNDLGTKAELQSLCTEAEKYGIKIIVDVVANHLAGDHSNIQNDLKDSQYWHTFGGNVDWSNRWEVTHGEIGMPDLNSEHSYVQQVVKNYINELKSIGVDGIRWDAAKHIALPSEGCGFWPTVTSTGLYNYGEILVGPDDRQTGNEGLMKEYTNYMSVTDSSYGKTLRDSFNSGTVPTAYANWAARGISDNKLVYWGESHDTWSNNQDWGYSNGMSQNVIDRAYAVAASRNNITGLYFSRPSSTVKNNIKAGQKGSTHFTSAEVAAVNHFHNAMIGQKDYYATQNNVAVVCREKGAVIVLGSGSNRDVSVPNGGGITAPGTYIDEITGSTWTVTSTTISGHVGSSGIAVVYAGQISLGSVSASPTTNTSFTDTLTVTLQAKNISNATYTTSEGASGSYTNGQKITIGASTLEGSNVTLTLKGVTSTGETITEQYVYHKKDPSAITKLYFDNKSYNWSSVYAYIYDDSTSSAKENAAWPGEKMTYNSTTGYYEIIVDDRLSNGKAIFTESSSATTNRYPAAMQSGLSINGSSMLFGGSYSWSVYVSPDPTIGSVSANPVTGTTFTDTLTVTLKASKVSSAKYATSEGASGTYTTGTTINVGASTAVGSSVTLTLTGTNSDGSTVTEKYVYYKKAPVQELKVYFDNTSYNWSKVYAYIYDDSGTLVQNASWPGKAMTYKSDTGLYEIAVNSTLANGKVIFTESSSATTNRYPADMQPGLSIGNTEKVFGKSHSWTAYTPVVKEFTNNSAVSAEKIALGKTVAITASSQNGSGTVQYAVYYKKTSDSKWTTKQNFGTNTSMSIKPAYATTYDICVKAKDSTNTILKQYFKLTVTQNANTDLSNTSTISAESIGFGSSVTVKCSSTTGTSYAVYYKKTTDSAWTKKQDFSSNKTVSLKPASATPYLICVKAKDSSGNIAKMYYNLTVTASAKSTLTNTSTVSATSVKKGNSVTFKAAGTGGTGTKNYAVYYKKSADTSWKTKQNFSSTSSVSMSFGTAGTYSVCVKVKDSSGNIAKKYFYITVT